MEKFETVSSSNDYNENNVTYIRKHPKENLVRALFSWFKEQELDKVSLSNCVLKSKAKDLKLLGYNDFKCSDTWIYLFKIRHTTFSSVIIFL